MDNNNQKGGGLRFNTGKNRWDLLPINPVQDIVKVFTRGAEKYAPRNWERGMPWSTVAASLERHWAAYKAGEDFDPESGLPHLAHVATNCLFILEYMRTYPEGDDRLHKWRTPKRVGLDIDEVICDWVRGFQIWNNLPVVPAKSWNFTYKLKKLYLEMPEEERRRFYLSLKPKMRPEDLPFEPVCYITARTVPTEITEAWLEMHGFPTSPVITVKDAAGKVAAAKEWKLDLYVDDRYEYFQALNAAGITTYLWDAPHNQRYDVGYRRITSLNQLP